MERLTKISEEGNAYYPKCFEKPCYGMGECIDGNCELLYEACEKLAEYESLEEQGLMVRLPCQIGTEVYCIITEITGKHPIIFKTRFSLELSVGIEKSVFLTREEAEKKLEEMQK